MAKASKTEKSDSRVKSTNTTHPPNAPDYPDYRVSPEDTLLLAAIDADESEGYKKKKDVKDELKDQRKRIRKLQEKLYAENKRGLLIVLQALDAGGKDGAVKHVFRGVNPQGCRVSSFKVPNPEEANHDFLWRYHKSAPAVGNIGVFNRSHYEDVLVTRVKELVPEETWRPRFELIRNFEWNLTQNNISVIKFYLHISKDEQKRRLQRRLDRPDKRWKFSTSDLKERGRWDDYQEAYEETIQETSTDFAPWYVIPGNKKWYRNLVIARAIAETLEAMNPQFPEEEKGLDRVTIPD